jgi:hypothetical protein
MAFRKAPPKDPDETLDYGWDWGEEYLPQGDEVTASSWDVPAGLTKESDSFTAETTTVWLSGGTEGEEYTVTNSVTTKHGRQADRSFTVKIRSK